MSDKYKTAYEEWVAKTDWVQETSTVAELGMHRADVLRKRIENLQQEAGGAVTQYMILAITTAYEQGVGKGHQAATTKQEVKNPYTSGYRCDLAWQYGYEEGKEQAGRGAQGARHSLDNLIGCFDAAISEGLHTALNDTTDEHLKDLVVRRLMVGYEEAISGAAPQPKAPHPSIDDLCARIKAADDAAADIDYMLDSDDCIKVMRGEWAMPLAMDKPDRAAPQPEAAAGPTIDYGQFLSDVMTAAGLVAHGKQCKALSDRLGDMVMRLRAAPQPEAAAMTRREQAAQRVREAMGIDPSDVTDPLHPRYIAGFNAGHAAGKKRAAPQPEAQAPAVPAQCTNSDSWNCKYCRKNKVCDALGNCGERPRAAPEAPNAYPMTGNESEADLGPLLLVAPQPEARADEAIRKDAERYRFLRVWQEADDVLIRSDCRGVYIVQLEAMDAAIDAALAAQGGV
jgi:hypothetical protein